MNSAAIVPPHPLQECINMTLRLLPYLNRSLGFSVIAAFHIIRHESNITVLSI